MKHAKFLSPFLSINHQCTKKHKARVFIIRYCIIVKILGGGGEVEGFGGEASPPHPPVDETLTGFYLEILAWGGSVDTCIIFGSYHGKITHKFKYETINY